MGGFEVCVFGIYLEVEVIEFIGCVGWGFVIFGRIFFNIWSVML
jgi:hypothetical protein